MITWFWISMNIGVSYDTRCERSMSRANGGFHTPSFLSQSIYSWLHCGGSRFSNRNIRMIGVLRLVSCAAQFLIQLYVKPKCSICGPSLRLWFAPKLIEPANTCDHTGVYCSDFVRRLVNWWHVVHSRGPQEGDPALSMPTFVSVMYWGQYDVGGQHERSRQVSYGSAQRALPRI
jgi:hypothetical protein